MEHSELFLLLPKYEEAEGQPDYLNAKSIMTEHDILQVIDNIDEERKATATDDSTFLLVNQDAFPCSTPTIKTKRNQEEVELDVKTADIRSVSKFKRESDHIYHGFHLDATDEKRVPEHIKQMISKLT